MPNPSKNVQQTHSGSGDNVAGDKIERQIHLGANSTYIEHQVNYQATSAVKPTDKSSLDGIRQLIARDRLSEALRQLVPHDQENLVISLQRRLSHLEMAQIKNIISFQDAQVERAQIADGILHFLNQLT